MVEFIQSAPFVLSAIIVIAIAIAVLVEFEKEGWATTMFSLGSALILWNYKSELWDIVSNNTLKVSGFVLAYLFAGVLWSLWKWKIYVNVKIDVFQELKDAFVEKMGPVQENFKEWIEYLRRNNFATYSSMSAEELAKVVIPFAKNKKALITSWISYWPMSAAATFLNNPFKKLFAWIYKRFASVYELIGSNARKSIMEDLQGPPVENAKTGRGIIKG